MNHIKNKKDLETTVDELKKSAYSYLEKYNPSKQQLRTYLFKKTLKKHFSTKSKKDILNLIDVILETLEDNQFINDKFYSDSKAKIFLRRGYSLNKIRHALIKKGISEKYIQNTISKIKNDEVDPDFFSALKICKKRRIGPIREESNRTLFYKKDVGILARSGFSYEISKKVLDLPKDEFNKFYKLI